MPERKRWLLSEVALLVGICLIAAWFIGEAIRQVPFHGSENFFVRRSDYFRALFLDRDLGQAVWGDSYHTHTQPMLANYVVGGSLWAHGYPVGSRLRVEHGPGHTDRPMLTAARAPMLFFGTGTILMLYLIGRVLSGRVAGLVAAMLGLGSPLAQEYLPQARTEPLLCFFFLLALLLSIVAAQRHRDGRLPARWAVALGIALGLAFGSKLTAVLSLVVVLSWAIPVAVVAARRAPAARQAGRAARGWVLALAIALGIFVLSNPHLYANPPLHTLHLFQQRTSEMGEQFADGSGTPHPDPLARPLYVLNWSLFRGTTTGWTGVPLEALVASIGALLLVRRCRLGWRRDGRLPAEGLVLLTAGVYLVGISTNMLVGWSRYALPNLLLGTILSGVGVAALVAWLRGALHAWRQDAAPRVPERPISHPAP